MEFLDLSDPSAHTVIINFPGRPQTLELEKDSHLGFEEKYRIVGEEIRKKGIGFIGCQQKFHNHEIIEHTNTCLGTLVEQTRDKIVILMASSAGAGGVLASPVARRIASGLVLLNTNPYNVGKEIVEADVASIPGWIDFYNGFEDYSGHAKWAERIAKENHSGERYHTRIDGHHSLTANQVFDGILVSLRKRNIIE